MVATSTWCGGFWLLLLLTASSFVTLSSPQAEESATNKLTWHNISQPYIRGALCNDFTPAGYFIRKVDDGHDKERSGRLEDSIVEKHGQFEDKYKDGLGSESNNSDLSKRNRWVIFLEGGGSCVSPYSCNQRYMRQRFKRMYKEFQKVDPSNNGAQAADLLMTSLWRYSNYKSDPRTNFYDASSNTWTIEGRDLLSTSKTDNPDFYEYNHVLIPYCSSDFWLWKTNNFRKALQKDFEFQFNPDATEQQFTFRGTVIIRSVIEDLYSYHNFGGASEVIFAGSGAGGLGALNHAYWLNEMLARNAGEEEFRLYVLLDSSWFVNFNNALSEQYSPEVLKRQVANGEVTETCLPTSPAETGKAEDSDYGNYSGSGAAGNQTDWSAFYMPCLSVQGIMKTRRYPANVPVMIVFSHYDVYYLLKTISSLLNVDNVSA